MIMSKEKLRQTRDRLTKIYLKFSQWTLHKYILTI